MLLLCSVIGRSPQKPSTNVAAKPEKQQLGHQSAILLAAGGLSRVLSSLLHDLSQACSS